jgi:hypothetical protein
MEKKYIDLIKEYYDCGVSVAGITSLLYGEGLTGIRYMEVRKYVQKEIQRFK